MIADRIKAKVESLLRSAWTLLSERESPRVRSHCGGQKSTHGRQANSPTNLLGTAVGQHSFAVHRGSDVRSLAHPWKVRCERTAVFHHRWNNFVDLWNRHRAANRECNQARMESSTKVGLGIRY